MLILEFISDRKLPAEDLLIWSDDLLGLERIRKFRMILEDDTRECCTVGAICRLLFAADAVGDYWPPILVSFEMTQMAKRMVYF